MHLTSGESRQLTNSRRVHIGVITREYFHAHAGRAARLTELVVRGRLWSYYK